MAEDIGITLLPVQSSNVRSRGYNEGSQVLAVEFTSGDVWHFPGVPLGLWERFRDAPSPGSFFAHHIKGQFAARKMTGECPRCGDRPGPLGTRCTSCGTADYAPKEARHNAGK